MKSQTVKTQKDVSKKLPKIINVNGNELLAGYRMKPEKFKNIRRSAFSHCFIREIIFISNKKVENIH